MTKLVCQFVPFKYAVDVCDTCGNMLSAHPGEQATDDLTKAMWKVLLEIGGEWSYYGGCFDTPRVFSDGRMNKTASVRSHMVNCEINWKLTKAPDMTEFSEFCGTFNPSEKIEVLAGYLCCKCGEVMNEEWGVQGITLGQLIWKVVHADDE